MATSGRQRSCPAQHLLLLSPDSHQARRHMPTCSGRECLSACHVLHRVFNNDRKGWRMAARRSCTFKRFSASLVNRLCHCEEVC